MKSRIVTTSGLALFVLVGGLLAADKAGLGVGQTVPGPFEPLNINGTFAGEKKCQYCLNGNNPVAMVFAREVSEPVTKLVKQIDAATAKNGGANMGSFFVFLSDDESMQAKLKDLAKKEDLKKTVLTLDNKNGPQNYDIPKDADVMVVLYVGHVVKANHTFKKGEMKDKDIEKVLADLPKIVK
jgi:hypothetical protein